MGDHQQFIRIDEVVSAYLDRSEQSVHRQFKIWHIAFDGLKELGIDFFSTVKSLKTSRQWKSNRQSTTRLFKLRKDWSI